MGRRCAWCHSLIGEGPGPSNPTTHVLCAGCLDDLKAALESHPIRIPTPDAVAVEGQAMG